MKRLVVCCDGTWKRADDQYVSNIEKIARAIAPRGRGADDNTDTAVQLVHYSAGVGSGAVKLDRLLGGAFGVGLDDNLLDAYRFLALNYEVGDQIFIFGFSRGAYTARSLVGMINYVGLLTRDGMVATDDETGLVVNPLANAVNLYRGRPGADKLPSQEHGKALAAFRAHTFGTDIGIRFLGVFDTVGAMGVPGLAGGRYRFHDVALSKHVQTARQALAIDERRRVFAPSVWESTGIKHDVKQVWFEGVHSDVGGGYPEYTASDQPLAWMVREARLCGLEFDINRLRPDPRAFKRHESLTGWYRIANMWGRLMFRIGNADVVARRIVHGRRAIEIDNDAADILIASTAYERLSVDGRAAAASNIMAWLRSLRHGEIDIPGRIEPIPPLGSDENPPSASEASPAIVAV